MFDIRTLYFLGAIINIFLAMVLMLFWRSQKTYSGFGFWTLAAISGTVGFLLLALRNIVPDFFSIVVGNLLALLYIIFSVEGVRRFSNAKNLWKINLIVFGFMAIFLMGFTYIDNNIFARTAGITLVESVYILNMAQIAFQHKQPQGRILYSSLGWVSLFYALVFIARFVFWVLYPENRSLFNATPVNTFFVVILTPVNISLDILVIALHSNRLAEELQTNQTRLLHQAYILKNLSEAIVETDANYVIRSWNNAAENMFGWKAGEVIGKNVRDLSIAARPSDDNFSYDDLAAMLTDDFKGEGILYHRSGKEIQVMFSIRVLKDALARPETIIAVISDINNRKKAEAELRQMHALLNATGKIARVGGWEVDLDSINMTWTDEIYHILEVETTFIPEHESIKQFITPASYDLLLQAAQKAIHNEESFDLEIQMFTARGKIIWAHVIGQVEQENVKRRRIFGALQDISEAKVMEQMMVEGEKLAGIGTLAAGMAHEINTPLQIITGASEKIKRKLDHHEDLSPEELERSTDYINHNAWRIAAIVRSILDYARNTVEKAELCSLNDITQKTLVMVEHQFKSWSNTRIESEFEDDLPEIYCDPNKITQVLLNLLTNARDAMPRGGVITVRTSSDPQNGCVVLRVQDTGKGIPEEIRPKIFDPFFTTKPVGKGTGLGLSIATGILRAHGGELELENSSNTGTTFRMALPINSLTQANLEKEEQGRF